MKINFKKLAMSAGVTAAMAAGSMSAHAVITAVPAPAQLVPLFYYGGGFDTDVRITVPKAVGQDSVITLLSGQRNGSTNIPVDTSWNTPTGAFKPTVVVDGGNGGTILANDLHWYLMNNRSEEICNGIIQVTPDDSVWVSAERLGDGPECGDFEGQASYLIIGNQSAFGGGAPEFSFAADAWVENSEQAGYPDTFSIPVLALADDVDNTTFPTPTNNLIEAFPAQARGPIASPIHTGIRTSTTAAGFKFRVVDLPIHNTSFHSNTLVAWVDSNAPLTGDNAGLGNGASGRLYGIGPDEEFSSLGSVSLPNQLNIVRLGSNSAAGDVTGLPGYTMGLNNCNGTCAAKAANPVQVAQIANLGEAADGGFLKFVFDAKALPAGQLAPGSYSSMIMFNVPGLPAQPVAEHDAPNMGIDTGFFTQN